MFPFEKMFNEEKKATLFPLRYNDSFHWNLQKFLKKFFEWMTSLKISLKPKERRHCLTGALWNTGILLNLLRNRETNSNSKFIVRSNRLRMRTDVCEFNHNCFSGVHYFSFPFFHRCSALAVWTFVICTQGLRTLECVFYTVQGRSMRTLYTQIAATRISQIVKKKLSTRTDVLHTYKYLNPARNIILNHGNYNMAKLRDICCDFMQWWFLNQHLFRIKPVSAVGKIL